MFKLVIILLFLSILKINKINCSDKSVELTASKTLDQSKPQDPALVGPVFIASHLSAVSALQEEAFDLMLAEEVCGEPKAPDPKAGLLNKEQDQALAKFVYSPINVPVKPTHKHKVPSDLKDFVDSSGSSGDYAKMLEKVLNPVANK